MSESRAPSPQIKQRPVRSFVRREGRATAAQKQAMQTLWLVYGFDPGSGRDAELDSQVLFGRDAPLVLEIGYGDGEALVDTAVVEPGVNFIGAEVYTPGIGNCLRRIEQQNVANVRLCQVDAVELLNRNIADASLSEIRLFFPDPWPKKKHHKRRIVNDAFTRLITRKLKPCGRIHFATDWAPYAEWAMDVFEACPGLQNVAGARQYTPKPASRTLTKFERRGQRLGQASQDLIYRTIL
jgi:tRNA (guanine-N7-)-methyltransferase